MSATRIVVAGLGGRMGREIVAAAAADRSFQIVGGTVRPGTLAGRDFAAVAGLAVPGARVAESAADLLGQADVLIDFTTPATTLANAEAAVAAGRGAVVGTTGLSPEQLEQLRAAGARIPLLYARNTSVGVNALLRFLPALARALEGYDLEIVEHHHRHKKDAPSGTALALAEAIAEAIGSALPERAVYGREGLAPRQPGEIGLHALRGGGNTGEHWVLFADEGEQIEVVHRAYSRRTFALGALRAARWIAGRPAGVYAMADVLGG